MKDDTISRQAAIDALLHNQEVYSNNFGTDPIDKYTTAIIANDVQTIVQLPSAQRKGKWIYLNGLDAFECSVCGRQMVRNIFDYCPWCGAEMTKGEEDE